MNQEIKFYGYLTFEDSIIARKAIEKRKIFSSSGIATILTLIAITLVIMNIIIGTTETILMIVIIVITGILVGSVFWWTYLSSKKSCKKRYESECTKRAGILKIDKITIATDKTKTDILWELFEKVIELDEIIVIAKGKEYLGFAKYMFNSQTDWAHAKELIKNKMVQPST